MALVSEYNGEKNLAGFKDDQYTQLITASPIEEGLSR
jgi:hypothetical protein